MLILCFLYVLQEVRGNLRARKLGVCTPVPFLYDLDTNTVYLQDTGGLTLRDILNSEHAESESKSFAHDPGGF
jgi:tRNA A-37 threonylcarbamoyl transferase component Bud32